MLLGERRLILATADGPVDVPVRLFAPECEAAGTWSCRYEIGWPEGTWRMAARGADALQAVILATHMIGAELYTSTYHAAGRLAAAGRRGGYGFPVSANLRGRLIRPPSRYAAWRLAVGPKCST